MQYKSLIMLYITKLYSIEKSTNGLLSHYILAHGGDFVLSGRDGKITCRYYHAKELYFEPFSEKHQVHRSNTILSSLNS